MTSIATHAAGPALGRSGLRTPRSAAFAGIALAVVITISIVAAIRIAVAGDLADAAEWLSDSTRRNAVLAGLALMPCAGVAFLRFVGVLRDRIGAAEDRFFATLFLESGLLFIADFRRTRVAASPPAPGGSASLGRRPADPGLLNETGRRMPVCVAPARALANAAARGPQHRPCHRGIGAHGAQR